MNDQPKVVALTTIKYSDMLNPVEKVRSGVFLDTARNLSGLDIPCIAIYDECSDSYLQQVRELGVLIVPQSGQGMGVVRREAIRAGVTHYQNATYYAWLEPEKPNLPFHVESLVEAMQRDKSVLSLFNRVRMENYPEEQTNCYLFCRAVATYLLGFDLDYAFGPMVLTSQSIPFFLDYRGEYGDLWDSLFIPRLRIIKAQMGMTTASVAFVNDSRMCAVEKGNTAIILKRVQQLNNVVPSLIAEWQKLNE